MSLFKDGARMTTHEILVDTRNRLSSCGWANCGPTSPRRPSLPPDVLCLEEALGKATYGEDWTWSMMGHNLEACDAFQDTPAYRLLLRKSGRRTSLWGWNDGQFTSRPVFALLDECIAETAPEPHVELEQPQEALAT
jgi:hypothetical protein